MFSFYLSEVRLSDSQRSEKNVITFRDAVRQIGIFPLHLMCDRGTENYGIAACQFAATSSGIVTLPPDVEISDWHRSIGPVDVVSSFRNIRSERPWRSYNDITSSYREFFIILGRHGYIDPKNPFHVATLHVAFEDDINKKLQRFRVASNGHYIRRQKKVADQNHDFVWGIPNKLYNTRGISGYGVEVQNYDLLFENFYEHYCRSADFREQDLNSDQSKAHWVRVIKLLWYNLGLRQEILPREHNSRINYIARFLEVKDFLISSGYPMHF